MENRKYAESKKVFNEENGTLDMSKMLVTDTKYNIRSFPPREAIATHEIKIQNRRQKMMHDFNLFRTQQCDRNGKQKTTNITKEQKIGRKRLQERVDKGEVVITLTDKSGKFAIVEKDVYMKAAEVHLNDEEIEPKDVTVIETLLNRHATQMTKCFKMGTRHGKEGQEERIKQAFTSVNGRPGPLSFLVKDHKGIREGEVIPPLRPLCNAKGGIGARMSNLSSTILNRAADAIDEDTECQSTEDARRKILECNRIIEDRSNDDAVFAQEVKDIKVLSMDVKALYPSLKIKEVTPILEELLITAQKDKKFYIENVDWKEVGKYLAITTTKDEQERKGITSAVPKTKRATGENARGRKPGPAYWESDLIEKGDGTKTNKWIHASEPSEEQKQMMLALVLMKAVETSMSNHTYRFGGKIYKQSDGGPIGDELSQAVARLVMIWWDRKFLEICTRLEIRILFFTRYVDDTNLAVLPQPAGTRFISNELVEVPELREVDNHVGTDKATGRLLKSIADSITPMLELEEDVCSNYEDNMIPILDLKVWPQVGEDSVEIKHTFYKKPMANKVTLRAGTAYPISQLRAIMVEEILRRLRNCSPSSSWEEKGKHLTEFANCMKCSGHKEEFRRTVFNKAVARYRKELEDHVQGIKDIYRSKVDRRRDTKVKGGKASKDTWFRKKQTGNSVSDKAKTTSVLKVPFTAGALSGRLSETLKKTTAPEGISTRVQEGGGSKLKDQLVRLDPFPKDTCSRSDCSTTSKGNDRTGCRETCFQGNVNYSITCDTCERQRKEDPSCVLYIYIGETARGCYERFKGHLESYRQKKGFMWKHAEEAHNGSMNLKFSIKREAVDPEPMRRIIRESIRINDMEWRSDVKLMNTKEEFFGVKTVRATFSQL